MQAMSADPLIGTLDERLVTGERPYCKPKDELRVMVAILLLCQAQSLKYRGRNAIWPDTYSVFEPQWTHYADALKLLGLPNPCPARRLLKIAGRAE